MLVRRARVASQSSVLPTGRTMSVYTKPPLFLSQGLPRHLQREDQTTRKFDIPTTSDALCDDRDSKQIGCEDFVLLGYISARRSQIELGGLEGQCHGGKGEKI